MATQDPEVSFEQVDWEEEEHSGVLDLDIQGGGMLVSMILILGAGIWDYFFLPGTEPTIKGFHYPTWDGGPALGFWELHRPVMQFTKSGIDVELVRSTWDVTSVEWLLMVVLAVMVFYVILPLHRNRRLSRYYWTQFKKNKAAVLSLYFLIFVSIVGLVGPVLIAPPALDLTQTNQPPIGITAAPEGDQVTGTLAHPLGTDHQGQDMLKLVIFGMRVSMQVGLISMFIAISIGTLVGATAAHIGGMVDEVLMRYVDLQSSFPSFLLLVLLVYLYGGSLILIIMLYGLLGWEGTARLIRSEALQRTEENYVQASEAAGASTGWIVRRHIVPNVSSTVITAATLSIPVYILGEASLSFLGFADDEIYSWGQVIAGGRSRLSSAPWISTVPGFFLFFTVLAINFVGDALRDAIDPRQDT